MYDRKYIALFMVMIFVVAFKKPDRGHQSAKSVINRQLFEHHYVTRDLPGDAYWGYGCPAIADFDKDGDLDILSKVWHLWPESANDGKEHGDFLENKLNELN